MCGTHVRPAFPNHQLPCSSIASVPGEGKSQAMVSFLSLKVMVATADAEAVGTPGLLGRVGSDDLEAEAEIHSLRPRGLLAQVLAYQSQRPCGWNVQGRRSRTLQLQEAGRGRCLFPAFPVPQNPV